MCSSNCTDTIVRPGLFFRKVLQAAGFVSSVVLERHMDQAVEVLREWSRRRRYRSYLAAMGDRDLKDIGLMRLDAEREADRPFWQAPVIDETMRGRCGRSSAGPSASA